LIPSQALTNRIPYLRKHTVDNPKPNEQPIVIAIDGTSASGKSTNAKLIAKTLNFVHVDTGAMYRTLAWYCLQQQVDVRDPRAVAAACRRWKTALCLAEGTAYLTVDGYYPAREIRTPEVSAAVPLVAAVPKVREWMKRKQRECIRFGSLVMEGRDIGTNVFPETDFKYYLDANPEERKRRREAEGVKENLEQRDRQDSQRAAAPLMIALGAKVINNSGQTPEQTSGMIIADVQQKLAKRGSAAT
jgi:cytidylate kinase